MKSFKRGIHPPQNKDTSKEPIRLVFPEKGAEVIYPCQQHIGAACQPIVKVGDHVLIGDKIADCDVPMSSPVHASVSGIIKAIRPSLTPLGITSNSIVIENDGEFTETVMAGRDYRTMSKEEILAVIRESGIVGLGGAGFPTHIKLNPPPDKKIDTIIVNAAECEPYLTTDHRVLLEEYEKLINGLEIIMSLHPQARGIIAIETNKQDAIDLISKAVEKNNNISVFSLAPKYPQGAEKQLIYACCKREVPSGGLPADIGCIVNNVDTVIAIDRAFTRGRPLMRKIVTIAGGAVAKPGNYKVRLGMTFKDFIESTGGLSADAKKIIAGGPMMGVSIFDLNVPIIKTTSALLCLTEDEVADPVQKNCIRCGKCVSHCPMGLLPLELNQAVLGHDEDSFAKQNGMDCIECGSCSYVCPSKRHLAQSIRFMRRHLMSRKKK